MTKFIINTAGVPEKCYSWRYLWSSSSNQYKGWQIIQWAFFNLPWLFFRKRSLIAIQYCLKCVSLSVICFRQNRYCCLCMAHCKWPIWRSSGRVFNTSEHNSALCYCTSTFNLYLYLLLKSDGTRMETKVFRKPTVLTLADYYFQSQIWIVATEIVCWKQWFIMHMPHPLQV